MAAHALAQEPSPVATLNPLTDTTLTRLKRALGPQEGEAMAELILGKMGLQQLASPQDLCDFANHLIQYGGVAEAVGRSLKVMALLRSAIDRPIPIR